MKAAKYFHTDKLRNITYAKKFDDKAAGLEFENGSNFYSLLMHYY